MFRRLPDALPRSVTLTVDGRPVAAHAGDSVAAVLLAEGSLPTRVSPASGAPRAPYCMMGVCFECLVTIDGIPNRQACLTPVAEGMVVLTGRGAPELSAGGTT